jgi:hypothetical protein
MDQETLDVPQAPQPDMTDACGCTQHLPAHGGSLAANPDPPESTAPTTEITTSAEASRRAIKLVLTLTPAEAGQYRAALAIGADGCDPLLRATMVSTLADALDQIPMLVEEAEAHWRLYPRNPATARAPSQQSRPKRDRSNAAPPSPMASELPQETPSDMQVEGEPASRPATERVAAPTRPMGGQLTLFG